MDCQEANGKTRFPESPDLDRREDAEIPKEARPRHFPDDSKAQTQGRGGAKRRILRVNL